MPSLQSLVPKYQSSLESLIASYNIPGAGVAIFNDGELVELSAGVTNLNTRVPVDADTLFLIGSITKTLTTTLIMQLVDEGNVDLDQPVKRYVPDLQLGTERATETVTVRQIVSHTSGIPGDYIKDFGRGDDALDRYITSYRDIGHLHEPNSMISYSNSAFSLAGRLIEHVTGQVWDDVLRERLLQPLGMDHVATLAEDALRYRVAIGHRGKSDSDPTLEVGEMWLEFRAGGPAGFTPWAAPRDLITFARMHMNGGASQSGEHVVSPKSVAAMQTLQKEPFHSGSWDGVGICLGFFRFAYDGERVFGHNGGRSATLRFIPDRHFAITVLTNAGGGTSLASVFIESVVDDLFGINLAKPPATNPSLQLDTRNYVGVYEHVGNRVRVEETPDGLVLVNESVYGVAKDAVTRLLPVTETMFVNSNDAGDTSKVSFVEPGADGRFRFFHLALRAFKRVD